MTDIEMTKLAAEAMEARPTLPGTSAIWGVTHDLVSGKRDVWLRHTYDPLHDDAQAMALAKKFPHYALAAFSEMVGDIIDRGSSTGLSYNINYKICHLIACWQSFQPVATTSTKHAQSSGQSADNKLKEVG